jgi:hypothetical protein
VPTVLKSESLNLQEPSEPVQDCNGIAYLFILHKDDNKDDYDDDDNNNKNTNQQPPPYTTVSISLSNQVIF